MSEGARVGVISADEAALCAPLTPLERKQAALYQSLSLARDCWWRMERLDTRGAAPGIKYLMEKCARDGHLRNAQAQYTELRLMGPGAVDHVLRDMLAFEGLL